MTWWTLARRSLRFHARIHVGVLVGAAIGSTALIGALIIGDSVKGTLRNRALLRLANAYYALAPMEQTFSQELGERLRSFPKQGFYSFRPSGLVNFAALLALNGTASLSSGEARANRVQV